VERGDRGAGDEFCDAEAGAPPTPGSTPPTPTPTPGGGGDGGGVSVPLVVAGAADGGVDLAHIDGSGFVDVPIVLMKQNAESGIHAVTAVFDNHYGLKGLVAAPLVVELE